MASGAALTSGTPICIVTSGPIYCGPRVVKEADALAAAGFRVRVVAAQNTAQSRAWDDELVRDRDWSLRAVRWYPVGLRSRYTWLKSGLRQRYYRELAERVTFRAGIAERAYSRFYRELARLAASEPAALYIAHNAQALPPAFRAAQSHGARVAFDSEDLHSGEAYDGQPPELGDRLLIHLEQRYLPACNHVTAASVPLARALAERYGIAEPTAIHNVFPWCERAAIDGLIRDRRGPALSLYWYSQVVGLDRGLQDVIRALPRLTQPAQLHVRGYASEPVKRELLALATQYGVEHRLFFHATVPPAELLSRAAEHDVGLALEQPVSENRRRTVTNKLFLYLLAGLAVAASDTIGQRSILETCPDAGFLYRPGDEQSLARELQAFLDRPVLLEQRKRAALRAAQERWNWEHESARLLDVVERSLRDRGPRARSRA